MFSLSRSRQSVGVRSGFYSAAFLLQRMLADQLDVDPTEIEIADITKLPPENGMERNLAQIILTDELPNGSGFVRRLYEDYAKILSQALNPDQPNSYLGRIHTPAHQHKCADACYDCLKVYRNMNWHSLLDWRLGLGMLRLLSNASYKSGADGKFDDFVEIRGWPAFAEKLRNQFINSFQEFSGDPREYKIMFKGLPAIRYGKNKTRLIRFSLDCMRRG